MTEENGESLLGEVAEATGDFAELAGTMVATSVLADSADAVLVCDVSLRVVAWNPAAERVFGWTAQEALGRSATQFLERPNRTPHALTATWRDASTRTAVLRRRDGTPFVAHLTRSGVFSSTGDRVAELNVVRPLGGEGAEQTTGPRSEPAARRLAEVYHDMRQPLTTIEYLLQEAITYGEDSLTRGTLIGISRQVKYLVDLTAHLLAENRPVREAVDVGMLIEDVAATVRGAAVKDAVPVEVVTSEPLVISADGVEVRRALVNLVENAIRAAGSRGQVRLSAVRGAGMVVLCVEDSGKGFEGGINSARSLGLVITEQVALTHGGRLDVGVSDSLGGAAFRLLLPYRQA